MVAKFTSVRTCDFGLWHAGVMGAQPSRCTRGLPAGGDACGADAACPSSTAACMLSVFCCVVFRVLIPRDAYLRAVQHQPRGPQVNGRVSCPGTRTAAVTCCSTRLWKTGLNNTFSFPIYSTRYPWANVVIFYDKSTGFDPII